MDLKSLLDDKFSFDNTEEKERASQMLKVLDGLSIWKAKELLDGCAKALEWIEIHYK